MHQQIATRIDHQCSIGGTIGIRAGMMIGVAVGLCGGSAAGALKGKKKETSDGEKENGEK